MPLPKGSRTTAKIAALRDRFVERVEKEIPYVRSQLRRQQTAPHTPSVAQFQLRICRGRGHTYADGFQRHSSFQRLERAAAAVWIPPTCCLPWAYRWKYPTAPYAFPSERTTPPRKVDYVVDKLKDTIQKLRAMSPLFNLKNGGTYNVLTTIRKVLDAFAHPQKRRSYRKRRRRRHGWATPPAAIL